MQKGSIKGGSPYLNPLIVKMEKANGSVNALIGLISGINKTVMFDDAPTYSTNKIVMFDDCLTLLVIMACHT